MPENDDTPPAGNNAADDSLDAAAEKLGFGAPADDAAKPSARGGRPRGAKGRGPSKDEWRIRARKAEAELRAHQAEQTAVAAEMDAAQLAEAAQSIRGPIELTVRWWTSKQAEAKGEHWRVSDVEAETLAEAWSVGLAPWAGYLAKYAPLGVALTVTVQTFRPRLQIDRENAKRAESGTPDGQHA